MMISLPSRRAPLAALAFAAAAMLACADAHAQGTDAQREACAPDAVKLCENTIPDVPKTTACMKAHYAQLSPACKTAFDDAIGPSRKARPDNRVAGREVGATPPAEGPDAEEVVPVAPAPERVPGLRAYEADIRKSCRQGLIDPFTCRNTLDALRDVE